MADVPLSTEESGPAIQPGDIRTVADHIPAARAKGAYAGKRFPNPGVTVSHRSCHSPALPAVYSNVRRDIRPRRCGGEWQDGRVAEEWLAGYRPQGEQETAEVARMRVLAGAGRDPWLRSLPLHFTASAVIVHPETNRVLLRWHQRQGRWLQVGGHGDPGESDPLAIALREAEEESGLTDLAPWPDTGLRHVAICQVAPGKGEPAHEHADLRYFLATGRPEGIVPENPESPLRWLSLDGARDLVGDNNIRITLERLAAELALHA